MSANGSFRATPRLWIISLGLLVLSSVLLDAKGVAQDVPRKLIAKTAPAVPDLAKKMHLSGKVKVQVTINPKGSVVSAKLVGGNPVFEANALEAVKQWKFEPSNDTTTGIVVLEFTGH